MGGKKAISGFWGGIVLFAAWGSAETMSWKLDPAHSSVGFAVKHMMVAQVRGQFTSFQGTVVTEGLKPETAHIEVTIDASSIDTRNGDRDKHLRSSDFLDVEKFPAITFRSKKVEAAGAGKLQVVGDLTLHGVTKEITLHVEGPTPTVRDPWGNLRVGAHATATINRKDFGILWSRVLDTGELVVGDEVNIVLDVELVAPATAPPRVNQ